MLLALTGRGIMVNPGALGGMQLGGGWLCDAKSGSFKPLEAERGTFGVLEMPVLEDRHEEAGIETVRTVAGRSQPQRHR